MTESGWFVETEGAQLVRAAIEMANRNRKYPSLVTGEPGVGKTTALRQIGAEYGAVYCKIDERTKDSKNIYLTLIAAYRQTERLGCTTRQLGNEIYWYLRERYQGPSIFGEPPGPLLVDEYQNAEATALRELLNICEECRVPLVLAGNEQRLARTTKKDSFALEQINSRIAWRVRLDAPSARDCRMIALRAGIEDDRTLDELASFGAQTTLRALEHILNLSRELAASAGRVEHHHVKTALKTPAAQWSIRRRTKGEIRCLSN